VSVTNTCSSLPSDPHSSPTMARCSAAKETGDPHTNFVSSPSPPLPQAHAEPVHRWLPVNRTLKLPTDKRGALWLLRVLRDWRLHGGIESAFSVPLYRFIGTRNVISVVHLLESLVERYHFYPSHGFIASISYESPDSYFVFTTNPGNFDNSTTLLIPYLRNTLPLQINFPRIISVGVAGALNLCRQYQRV
jgi:hypothetical protein